MNLLKSPLRRTTAVLAGAVIGMAGAVAFAAPASATHPTVTGSATCVSEEGWTVEWKVTNTWPVDGYIKDITATPNTELVGDIAKDAKLDKEGGNTLVAKQVIPADVDKAKLRVAVKFDNGHRGPDEEIVQRPTEKCAEPEPEPTPTPTPTDEPSTPAGPEPILEADCDTMTVGLKNPTDEDITLTFETSKGEKRTLEIKAGEEGTEKFSASEGFTVTVGFEGSEDTETIAYEQPEGCEGAGGGEPELPLTGAAAGSIAGGAGALLAIGGVLFFLARRRKVKFTA